jgi:hypothetical protein
MEFKGRGKLVEYRKGGRGGKVSLEVSLGRPPVFKPD